MTAYYNENDKNAAAWLRELIKKGLIARGEVDERDIRDVTPAELGGYTQCHFFAGIGGWSYALRLAGWDDERPVWTGSCPCQPFSTAGRRAGVSDERHLWPHFHWLISQCSPPVVFGEQVASKDGLAWLDLVQADLERAGYAVGAADLCAAGIGAPHIRQRLFWVADAKRQQRQECLPRPGQGDCAAGSGTAVEPTRFCISGGLADAHSPRLEGWELPTECARELSVGQDSLASGERPGPVNGFWRDADWLFCRDGKWRAVEPGSFPLAHGLPGRVGRLRGYGNAIVPQVAAQFIAAYMETI